jgi:hypothetical protein
MHFPCQQEIQESGQKNNENEFWPAPAVKENTEQQNEKILVLLGED